ncbi:E3 ubiquitin-protein ligase MARCH9 [Varanus komodoensis]|nr:E3 ubiquitin-protein ligase MARCH9 [Varanus komodoensis]
MKEGMKTLCNICNPKSQILILCHDQNISYEKYTMSFLFNYLSFSEACTPLGIKWMGLSLVIERLGCLQTGSSLSLPDQNSGGNCYGGSWQEDLRGSSTPHRKPWVAKLPAEPPPAGQPQIRGELLSPCRCDGSVRCTHQPCLIRWISERGSWSCELCYFKYQVLAISTKNPLQWQAISLTVIEKVQIAAIILGSLFLIASISWLIWSSLSPSAKWQRQDLLFQICYGMYGFMDIVCIGLIIHEGSSVYRIFKRWQAVNQQWKVLNYDKAKDLGEPNGEELHQIWEATEWLGERCGHPEGASARCDDFAQLFRDKIAQIRHELDSTVDKGSILSPMLFNIYMKLLGEVIRRFGLQIHQYADDTQLYLSFTSTPGEAVAVLNRCLAESCPPLECSFQELPRVELGLLAEKGPALPTGSIQGHLEDQVLGQDGQPDDCPPACSFTAFPHL